MSRTRRIAAALIAAAAITTTAACTTDDDTSSVFRHQAPASTTVTEQPKTKDDIFMTVIEDTIPGAGPAHIDLAHTICEALDAGASPEEVVLTMLQAGGPLDATQKGTLVGAAVPVYCPEHSDAMEAFFDQYRAGDPA